MKKQLTIFLLLFFSIVTVLNAQTITTIANARLITDTTHVTITGIVTSPNFQTANRSYFMQDKTAGIVTFSTGLTSPALSVGDSVVITGKISTYNGLIEITPVSNDSVTIIKSGVALPSPKIITVNQLNTAGETYEGQLVEIANLSKMSGTWPASKANATLKLTDDNKTDTLILYVDSDMGLYGKPEPVWPVHVIGVITQYTTTGTGGYELQPRYLTDFQGAVSIDSARKEVGYVVTVNGVVTSPNYQTVNRSYYFQDSTAGLVTFRTGLTSPALKAADSITVTGLLTNYNGLMEIQPLADTSVVIIDTTGIIPAPKVITIAQFNTNGEAYESQLIKITGLTKLSGTWPTSKSSATLKFVNAALTDTVTVYLDSDMSLNSISEPTYPIDIVGEASQFAASGVGGYQLLPRFTTDFTPSITVPVELTTFTAKIAKQSVVLSWETATEINNAGFNVERSVDSKTFTTVGFVKGNGTTTERRSYSFTDNNSKAGKYYYRLNQVDVDGTSKYSNVIEATVTGLPAVFTLSQNYPNPFNPSTEINFTVAKDGQATLKVFNSLGQEVSSLFNGQATAGQTYNVRFNASNLSSGIYFYQLRQGSLVKTEKMMLLK